jgi:Bacterial extracellular solute-binding proteins, family 5 Middle
VLRLHQGRRASQRPPPGWLQNRLGCNLPPAAPATGAPPSEPDDETGATARGGMCDEAKFEGIRDRICTVAGARRPGRRGAKIGRYSDHVAFRQSRFDVDARRSDGCRQPADDGRLQQSGHVSAGCRAKQHGVDRSRPGDRLVVDEEGTELTLPLRQGVRWHDGKPFTARDVKCTWDLLTGRSAERLRLDPRKTWYSNLEEGTTNGEYEVTFRLKRPQPSFLALLASGWSPVYPCHVSPRDMRAHPIGTGPFKFVEFRSNERIRVARNPEYWKPDRPYLDGIEWRIVPSWRRAFWGSSPAVSIRSSA